MRRPCGILRLLPKLMALPPTPDELLEFQPQVRHGAGGSVKQSQVMLMQRGYLLLRSSIPNGCYRGSAKDHV